MPTPTEVKTPYDYFTATESPRGLARIATLVAEARKSAPDALLIDCGDTIQGATLEGVYQKSDLAQPDPMMLVMNHLRYDAMTVGNHEYNYGLANLHKARQFAKFPWLSANTAGPRNSRPFAHYMVKTVDGIKVAIIGITTPGVPSWEKPENYKGYTFDSGAKAVERAVAELRRGEKPDLTVVAAHAGLESEGQVPGENMVREIAATVPDLDAIVFGHSHQQVAEMKIGNVLVTQPRNWGMSLARLEFDFDGRKVTAKRSAVIPVKADTPADPEVLRLAQSYHDAAEKYLNTPVADSPISMDGRFSRVEDTPLIDMIHEVQLHYAKADVSFASSFNTNVRVPNGPITVRQLAALYVYDNELYAIEGTGAMVKAALENAARFYGDPKVLGFNYDMAQGVEYEIDVTRPEGQRIVNLRYKGKPLDPAQTLRIALNNYRAGGSAGYSMFRDAKVLWRSGEEIREMMIRFYTAKKTLPGAADGNWKIIPRERAEALKAAARRNSAPRNQ